MARLRLALVLILGSFLAALVLLNRQPVRADLIFAATEMPLVLLLLITAAGGFLLGVLVSLLVNIGGRRS